MGWGGGGGWRLEVKILEAVSTDSESIPDNERLYGKQHPGGRFPELTV